MSLLLDPDDQSPSGAAAVAALGLNVRAAVELLGNALLQRAIGDASLTAEGYYAELLRLAYRLVFLLVAEERDLLHPAGTSPSTRAHYRATRRFARIAQLKSHEYDPHASDLWQGTREVLAGLGHGDTSLGLVALGGLFAQPEHPIFAANVENGTLVDVARLLNFVRLDERQLAVNWAAISGEELGSSYERLLELTPNIDVHARAFRIEDTSTLATARRSSGSYYTPAGLVDVVIQGALERSIAECLRDHPHTAAESLLSMRIVDPACGCGHFLLAAARRLADYLEPHVGEDASSGSRRTLALRKVIASCIYGVDLNPTAIELCKVNLWLEAAEPGTSLTFLDAHLKCGNALIGTPRDGVASGVPTRAWRVDDKSLRQELKRRINRTTPLPPKSDAPELTRDRHDELADVWCAAFFWPIATLEQLATAPTNEVWSSLLDREPHRAATTLSVARELAAQYHFFHWHLRFPEVFARGGFDVVLGNPPWIAHAGRAAQPLDAAVKHFFASNYAAFSKYITTHGLFASVLPKLLREGGYLGFVLPSSLSELDGYEPTRKAHDALCTFVDELTDFGEGCFEGVTQPCMALVTKRNGAGRAGAAFGSPWPVARPDLSPEDRDLLQYLHTLPRLPPSMFAERGLQSDPRVRPHFLESPKPRDRFTVPVREGTDVREFELLPARFHVDPVALGKRLRPASEFQRVGVVVRQTARYPIAAKSDGSAFRNSLLACFGHSELSARALVALLNSTLVRWHHYMRFRDARQPVLPQVKISHLRAIPEPPGNLQQLNAALVALEAALSTKSEATIGHLRAELDETVARAYGLSPNQTALLRRWLQT